MSTFGGDTYDPLNWVLISVILPTLLVLLSVHAQITLHMVIWTKILIAEQAQIIVHLRNSNNFYDSWQSMGSKITFSK